MTDINCENAVSPDVERLQVHLLLASNNMQTLL